MEAICQNLIAEFKSPTPPLEVKILSEEQALIKFPTLQIHVDGAHQFVVFTRVPTSQSSTQAQTKESEWCYFNTQPRLQRMILVGRRFLALPAYSSTTDKSLQQIPLDQ